MCLPISWCSNLRPVGLELALDRLETFVEDLRVGVCCCCVTCVFPRQKCKHSCVCVCLWLLCAWCQAPAGIVPGIRWNSICRHDVKFCDRKIGPLRVLIISQHMTRKSCTQAYTEKLYQMLKQSSLLQKELCRWHFIAAFHCCSNNCTHKKRKFEQQRKAMCQEFPTY